MPATLIPPPPGADAALLKGMQGVVAGGTVPLLRRTPPGNFAADAHGPVPVYQVTADQVRDGILPDPGHVPAWRYLIVSESGALAGCATVGAAAEGGGFVFSGYREDGNADKLLEAITLADHLADAAPGGAPVGIVECLALHFEALWVRLAARDLYIPLTRTGTAGVEAVLGETDAAGILAFLRSRLAAGSGVTPLEPP